MKHISYLVASVIVALGVSLVLSIFGAHGLLGAFAVYAGYCGGFVNWHTNPGRISYVLITAVNASVYWCALEIVGVLIGRRRDVVRS